ncbi:MAG TPA: MG2 domain-containing protein [Nevskiaceae bacterium]|nr:MG2 domain-containing protein [Nevskiaceae bacterium]
MIFSSKNFFLRLLFLTFFLSAINIIFSRPYLQPEVFTTLPEQQPQTLGRSTGFRRIYISGKEQGWGYGGVLALASTEEPAVEVGSYNVSGQAEITVYEADEKALFDYLAHDEKGNQLNKSVDTTNFQHITTTTHQINSGYDNTYKITLPLGETGIWYLAIQLGEAKENAFIIRSNIGVIMKEGDNEFIFWGQSFKTRRSITGGDLKIYNLQDGITEIDSTSFNQEGIAKTNLRIDADIGLVKKGQDLALIPINLRYLNYGYDYKYFQPKKREAKFFIFTDRPVYRPGDKIYFKSIIRDDDDARYTISTGMAQVKIYQSQDEPVFEKNYPITAQGTIYGEFDFPADVKTGSYSLSVDLAPGSENYSLRSSTYFRVEHFRKPEYSIDIIAPQTEFIAGDKSSFKISGRYFFGQPLNNQTVKYKIYSSSFYEYTYWSENRPQVTSDYRYGWQGGKMIIQDSARFNEKGEAEINLETKLPEGEHRSQVFSIEAEFDDGTGNPVFARKNILVYSGEYGIYRKDTLYSVRVGDEAKLDLTLVPYRDANVNQIPLKAKVLRTNWERYQDPNKKYPSFRKEEENLPDLQTTTDNYGNAILSFRPPKIASYKITVEGKDARGNLILKDFYFWVVSPDQPLYTGETDNELTIQPDKEKYLHTDVARLNISSNIADRDIFLSFDRARVNRFQVVHLNGTSSTVEVPLKETDMPNIFVKVASFSNDALDTGRKNIIVSTDPKKLLVTVTPDKKTYGPSETVTVNVQTTDVGGNPISANTAVWAVDKALFELVGKMSQKIFDAFWWERYDQTTETHSLQGIIVQTAEKGGGCFAAETTVLMGDGKTRPIKDIQVGDIILTRKSPKNTKLVKAKVTKTHSQQVGGYFIINQNLKVTPNHRLWINGNWQEVFNIQLGDALTDFNGREVVVFSLEWQEGKLTVYNLQVDQYQTYFAGGIWAHNQKGDAVRSIFKDTAYWNPSVQTDAAGQAQVRFKLPDNLTTWVIASIGSTFDTKVGQMTSEIVVTKDVVIRPILPNILRTEDEIVLSALVQNFTDHDHTFDIGLKFDSGKVDLVDYSNLVVKSKGFEQVDWKVRPDKENEEAKLIFSAKAADGSKLSDIIEVAVPVYKFGFWEKRGENGDGPTEFAVKFASDSDEEKSKLTLSLAPTLLSSLPTAMKYLVGYPYGCVEQTTSRFVPAVIAKINPDLFKDSIADKDVDDIIQKSISRLANFQRSDGGWTWWFSGDSDAFLTAYVVEYLVKAADAGIKVDENILAKAKSFLEQEKESSTRDETAARIYGLSLLGAESGRKLLTDFNDMTPDILALAVMANIRNGDNNSETNGLNKLILMAKTQGDGLYWEAGQSKYFGSRNASTGLALRAILAVSGERELAVKASRYLLRNRRLDYWSNTFGTAQVIQAAVDFVRAGEEFAPNYTYKVTLDGKEIGSGVVTDPKKALDEIVIKGTDIKKKGSDIVIEKFGEQGQLYSTLIIEEFHTDKKANAVNHGLEIKREYVDEKNEEYSLLGVGDTVTVKITAGGLQAPENYGVIVDELPSGMIPINPAFESEQYGQLPRQYQYGVSGREVTKNGMILSLYKMGSGTHVYTYQARVVSEGEFSAPPATAFLMYSPEIHGHSAAQTVKIARKSVLIPRKIVKKAKSLIENKKILILGTSALLILVAGMVFIVKRRRKLPKQPPKEPMAQSGSLTQSPPGPIDSRQ